MIPLALLRVLAPYAIGAALVGGAVWAVHGYGASRYAAGVADDKARSDAVIGQMIAEAETVRANAEREQRAEEQRRRAAMQEIVDDATRKARDSALAAADARRAADGLRQRFAALFASCAGAAGPDPSAAGASPSADGTAGMLADVLGGLESRARRYAEIADQRGDAGGACERSYGALTPATAPARAALPNVP